MAEMAELNKIHISEIKFLVTDEDNGKRAFMKIAFFCRNRLGQ